MNLRMNLLELEADMQCISDGLEMLHVMAIGLESLGSEYAGAVHALWSYCSDADQKVHKRLADCIEAV